LLGQQPSPRPVSPDLNRSPIPGSPTSVSSNDSLEAAIKNHSSFRRYLGGAFLSIYTVTVFIASVGLIGLSAASFMEYQLEQTSRSDSYVTTASVHHAAEFQSFINTGSEMMRLVHFGALYGDLFALYPAADNVLHVMDTSPPEYYRYTWAGDSVSVVSNKADCASSMTHSCDPEDRELSVETLVTASTNVTADASLWSGPSYLVNPSENTTAYPVLNLIRRYASDNSLVRIQLRTDSTYFKFSNDSLLDSNGIGRVFAFNTQTFEPISGLGIDSNINALSVTSKTLPDLSSTISDGSWLSELPSIMNSSVTVPGMSIAFSEIPDSPFAVIVASKTHEETLLYWLLLAIIAAAVAPVVATLILGFGYSLRMVAVRRQKRLRAMEQMDAQLAIQAMRESKIRSAGTSSRK